MKGCQLAVFTYLSPTPTIRSTMSTLTITMTLLTEADSLMPITRMVDMRATMNTAGTLSSAPVKLRPSWAHPATARLTSPTVHQRVGDWVRWAGSVTPNNLNRSTRCPDQPTPTVAAPAAYSSTRSQPMIQATNSPMVAYE